MSSTKFTSRKEIERTNSLCSKCWSFCVEPHAQLSSAMYNCKQASSRQLALPATASCHISILHTVHGEMHVIQTYLSPHPRRLDPSWFLGSRIQLRSSGFRGKGFFYPLNHVTGPCFITEYPFALGLPRTYFLIRTSWRHTSALEACCRGMDLAAVDMSSSRSHISSTLLTKESNAGDLYLLPKKNMTIPEVSC